MTKSKHLGIVHYVAPYIIDPAHPVTVNVIGCGGTGSQVINTLGRMDSALKALGHPGLYVTAIDDDRVTDANRGRQLFSKSDIGHHKCSVLIGRVNGFFGVDWRSIPLKYTRAAKVKAANITISCVDSGAARKEIKAALWDDSVPGPSNGYTRREPYNKPYYWMDFGNMKDRGQVVIGTVVPIDQPKKSEYLCRATLRTVDRLHKDIFKDSKNDDQGPSCSLAESLEKQDLLINSNIANWGLHLLWKMFRDLRISDHGLYINQSTLSTNPIKIK